MGEELLELEFGGPLFVWRGPAPFHFVAVPGDLCGVLRAVSGIASYGWGVIPVTVRVGGTSWETSLFPKDGRYLVPFKDAVRRAERLADGDEVAIRLSVRA
jgi:hypothetical protein